MKRKTASLIQLLWYSAIIGGIIYGASIGNIYANIPDNKQEMKGILFYKSDCKSCENLIYRFIPETNAEKEDKFKLLLVNTSHPLGGQLYLSAVFELSIPLTEPLPLLIQANRYDSGIENIKERIVSAEIDDAGKRDNWPEIEGISKLLDYINNLPPNERNHWFTGADRNAASLTFSNFKSAYAKDPIANQYAVIVLLCLLVSLALSFFYINKESVSAFPFLYRWSLLILSTIGILVTLQLSNIVGQFKNFELTGSLPQLLTAIVFFGMVATFMLNIWRQVTEREKAVVFWHKWTPLLLFTIGITVSLYLWVNEISHSEAVCGAVGNCNAVQQSPYAKLFGTIPVALFGVVGNIVFLGTWILFHFSSIPQKAIIGMIQWAILVFGVGFYVYLTFLEPFVIGETCFWCLTGAVAMSTQLLIQTHISCHHLRELKRQ